VEPACAPLRLLAALVLAWPAAAACADAQADPGVAAAAAPDGVVLSLGASVAATDNATAAAPGGARSDLLGTARPRVEVRHEAARLKLLVDASLRLLGSATGRGPATARPDIDASAKAILVDDLVFLDASAQAIPTQVDPFGPRPDPTSDTNARTERRFHVQPSLRARLAPHVDVELVRDDSLTRNGAGTTLDSSAHATRLHLAREPLPFGAALEVSRFDGATRDANADRLVLETARLRLDWRPGLELQLDAEGGGDRTATSLGRTSGALYGIGLDWRPTARTILSAALEHRFFGNGGELHLRHRNPSTSVELSLGRLPALVSQALDSTHAASLQAGLDAILTTRHPDQAARRALVDKAIAVQGLANPDTLPIDIAAPYPQMLTRFAASWTWSAPRTTVSAEFHSQTARAMRDSGNPLTTRGAFGADSRQAGASVQIARRLDPRMSVTLLLERARITGLADQARQRSDQRSGRLWLTRTLDARSCANVGVQHEQFATTATGQHGFRATVVFMGLTQGF
jgi:uncharacterized protein (PEP-CTERM system associated)